MMKIALVGIGQIARGQHVPAIAASPDWDLAATASHQGEVPGVESFPDVQALLAARPDIDTISLSIPPVPRFEVAAAVLAAGRNLMLEKPPGATLAEVHILRDMARAQGVDAAVEVVEVDVAGGGAIERSIDWPDRRRHPPLPQTGRGRAQFDRCQVRTWPPRAPRRCSSRCPADSG